MALRLVLGEAADAGSEQGLRPKMEGHIHSR